MICNPGGTVHGGLLWIFRRKLALRVRALDARMMKHGAGGEEQQGKFVKVCRLGFKMGQCD